MVSNPVPLAHRSERLYLEVLVRLVLHLGHVDVDQLVADAGGAREQQHRARRLRAQLDE